MTDWRTLEGEPIENVYDAIREDNERITASGGQLYAYFGTDGQNLGIRGTSFVQCIALHAINEVGIGKGGRVFYIRFIEREHKVRFVRLMREVELTMKLMRKIVPIFEELSIPWCPHVDIASDPRCGSYEAYNAARGWFIGDIQDCFQKGMFNKIHLASEAVFKPNAWVASIVADRHTRGVRPAKGRRFGKMRKGGKR